MKEQLAITQVNAAAGGGGAEGVARQLHRGFLRRGHAATLYVGRGEAEGEGVLPFPHDPLTRLRHNLAGLQRIADRRAGRETFAYPATRALLDQLTGATDVLHLHNLHGGYFDLRVLPTLAERFPVVLTLHDAWLLSGHCAHSFDCERWRTGCGSCPDLTIYPAIGVDETAANWQRKRDIFLRSRVHVAAPSAWLARRVEASILAPALRTLRVIPNGVDLGIFAPGDRDVARAALGLPLDANVLLFPGSPAPANPFKDFATVQRAADIVTERLGGAVLLLVLGGGDAPRRTGAAEVRAVPFLDRMETIVQYYRAADVVLHAAHADTFPTTVLEAMASGRPVVATAVGGIVEQVRSLDAAHAADAGATGVLVPRADAAAMASATEMLLRDAELRARLGAAAARIAARDYDAERQCESYLEWYRDILDGGRERERSHGHAVSDRA